MSFCPKCGSPNADDARFCEKCGSAIEAAIPAAATPPAQPAAQLADQAKTAVSSATVAVKKLNPVIIVGAVVLLVLIAVGIVVTRPMDKREYKKEAENYAEDLISSFYEISGDVYNVSYDYDDIEDELDASDVKDLRETYEKESKKIKEAARGIDRLRPPSDYKDADKDLRAWAKWTSTDGLAMLDDLLKQVEEDGVTYEDMEDIMSDFSDEQSDAGDDAFDALADAVDELNIDPYGEGD